LYTPGVGRDAVDRLRSKGSKVKRVAKIAPHDIGVEMATRKKKPIAKVVSKKMRKIESMMNDIFVEIFAVVNAEDAGKIGSLVKRKVEFMKVVEKILEKAR